MSAPLARFGSPERLVLIWAIAAAVARERSRRAADEVEAAIQAEAEAQGLAARVRAVQAALTEDDDAREAVLLEIDARAGTERDPRNEDDVRELIFDVLRARGIDTTDVMLKVFWAPEGHKRERLAAGSLRLRGFAMTPEARQRCIDAILAREKAAA